LADLLPEKRHYHDDDGRDEGHEEPVFHRARAALVANSPSPLRPPIQPPHVECQHSRSLAFLAQPRMSIPTLQPLPVDPPPTGDRHELRWSPSAAVRPRELS